MKVRLATTADYVNQTGDNKLNIVGIYLQLLKPGDEMVLPVLHTVFILQIEGEDYQTEKRLQVVVLDPNDEVVSQAEEIPVFIPPSPPPGSTSLAANLVTSIQNVPFRLNGLYHVRLLVDGQRFHDIDLSVASATESEPT